MRRQELGLLVAFEVLDSLLSSDPSPIQLSRIYGIIRDHAAGRGLDRVDYNATEAMVLARGFSAEQLAQCLQEYSNLGVLQLSAARTHIIFTYD